MATDAVIVVNCGSSSVKAALVDPDTGDRLVSAVAERVGTPDATLRVTGADEDGQPTDLPGQGTPETVRAVLDRLVGGPRGLDVRVVGVGHRVVHGGADFPGSVVIDDDVLARIDDLSELAPLHNPVAVAGIRAAREAVPELPQVAVFDTSFHTTMPPVAYRYAVPETWYRDLGVRRYGFHGTSHRYVAGRAAHLLGRDPGDCRLVTAHLGNGCSAAAVRDGRSVDTTMGLTPLEGLVMGTRSGDLDPSVLAHVARQQGVGLDDVMGSLNHDSGLLGLSQRSNDMRTVQQAAADGSAPAQLAVDVFCYRLAKYVAALVVPLGRLDALVFTGGIGEHDAAVRSAVLGHLGFLGLTEDEGANAAHGRDSHGRISAGDEPAALVVPTDEELVIARDTRDLVAR